MPFAADATLLCWLCLPRKEMHIGRMLLDKAFWINFDIFIGFSIGFFN